MLVAHDSLRDKHILATTGPRGHIRHAAPALETGIRPRVIGNDYGGPYADDIIGWNLYDHR